MNEKILVINTGSSSTKIALFKEKELISRYEITHKKDELLKLKTIKEEVEFRSNLIKETFESENINLESITAIGAIGGILKPVEGGVYKISGKMINDILEERVQAHHASNIAAIIAYDFSIKLNIPSFIVDPISTDELSDIARISGIPEIQRKSRTHALNVKACVRRARKELGLGKEANFIVAHIGGGLTINLVCNDRIIDIEDARQCGPFSTEAAGGVTIPDLIEFIFANNISREEATKYWYGKGGVVAHLGTNSIKDSVARAESGDKKAELVLDSMCYQIVKSIGALYVAGKGEISAIIITGGAAKAEYIVSRIKNYVSNLCRVLVYPGEEELNAIAESTFLVLRGELPIKEYI
jgi:butyrate kinase